MKKPVVYIVITLLFTACATYYTRTVKFQELLLRGDIEKASALLDKNKKDAEGRNRLLYNLNKGYLGRMLGNYDESNRYFNEADFIIEDHIKKPATEALALLTNPMVRPYVPEDFEAVMVNFFKGLNFVALNKYPEALVECRRMNIRLNALNDKYPEHKNKYSNDAFIHCIMGMIYEASRDYNNAFIAYRNAYEVYKNDYTRYFGTDPPLQLKKDIIRSAYLTGFYDEVRYYEKEFNLRQKDIPMPGSELVYIWFTGFGPVKSEWSINFTVVKGQGGWVTLVNQEFGLSFPYFLGDKSSNEQAGFQDLRLLRIAFPRYLERKPVFTSATVTAAHGVYSLETAQNINEIAFKSLNDRMLREIGSAILRLAAKKAVEVAASKQNQGLGAAVSIANALTEKADTRNWQTLPYAIHYARIPLVEGHNQLTLNASSQGGRNSASHNFEIHAEKGKTYFRTYHHLESYPPGGF